MKIKGFIAAAGFTLIELLVVISIIGILAAIVTVSFTSSQKQARDTQRKSDLAQYRTSLEAFAGANNSLYPYSGGGFATPLSSFCTSYLTKFAGNCPDDPKPTTRTYEYRSDGSGSAGQATASKYALYVNGGLESDANNTWVVCYNGKSGIAANSQAGIQAFCF